jgi:hypothetical protein
MSSTRTVERLVSLPAAAQIDSGAMGTFHVAGIIHRYVHETQAIFPQNDCLNSARSQAQQKHGFSSCHAQQKFSIRKDSVFHR